MPRMPRSQTRNRSFVLVGNEDGSWTADRMQVALLMDIREELQRLNTRLHCHNFLGMPGQLRAINQKIPAQKPRRRTA